MATKSLDEGESCGDVPPEELMKLQLKEKYPLSKECTKCKTELSVMIFRKESTCWKCFESLFVKKFKTGLNAGRKHRNKAEHVLLAFSGGSASRAMLHAVCACIEDRSSKATFFDISVVHIDEGALFNQTEEERRIQNSKIEEIVKSHGNIPFHLISLEDVYSIPSLLESVGKFPENSNSSSSSISSYCDNVAASSNTNIKSNSDSNNSNSNNDSNKSGNNSNAEKLRELFQKATTNTAKEDLLTLLRTSLLAHFTCSAGFEKVLVGNTASSLAATLVSSICKGRGFGVALEISQIDQHRFTVANSANCGVTNVTVHRPMSDFLDVEIDTYVKFNQLTTCQTPSLYSKATTHKFSIDYLSQSFIKKLQSEYFHTVHTLLRSGSKLTLAQYATSPDAPKCPLCSYPLSKNELLSIAKALELLKEKNTASLCGCEDKKGGGCGGNAADRSCCTDKQGRNGEQMAMDNLDLLACSACKRIFDESRDTQSLPPFVYKSAQSELASVTLRHQIKDYLLDDDDNNDA